MAFKFAASPNFMKALEQANAALAAEERDPMVATSNGAALKPPGEEQKEVGPSGLFARDVQDYGDEIYGRAEDLLTFKRVQEADPADMMEMG